METAQTNFSLRTYSTQANHISLIHKVPLSSTGSSAIVQLHIKTNTYVCVPAFVHSPQVHAGEGGVTLVPFAGVRRAPQGETLHVDLGNPISWLTVKWYVEAIEA